MKIIVYILLFLKFSVAAVCASPDKIEFTSDPISTFVIFQTFVALVVVLSLFMACAWVFKRWSPFVGTQSNQLEIISSIVLGRRDRVILLRCGDEKHVLLAVGSNGVQCLCELSHKESVLSNTIPVDGQSASKKEFKLTMIDALNAIKR